MDMDTFFSETNIAAFGISHLLGSLRPTERRSSEC
jgi:hypothetical protein